MAKLDVSDMEGNGVADDSSDFLEVPFFWCGSCVGVAVEWG